jgi:predicted metalloprotease
LKIRLAVLLTLALAALVAGRISGGASASTSAQARCVPPSLKDCYSKGGMLKYLNVIIPMVNQFFDTTWKAMGRPAAYIYIRHSYKTASSCEDTDSSSFYAFPDAYFFCGIDRKVYIGQDAVWVLYHYVGDVAPAVGLAHEFGHFVQYRTHVPNPFNSTTEVNHENQADCISGAWLGYADKKGWLEREDAGSLEKYVKVIADAEKSIKTFPTHGTASQRTESILLGYKKGIYACNQYYPDTPIIR